MGGHAKLKDCKLNLFSRKSENLGRHGALNKIYSGKQTWVGRRILILELDLTSLKVETCLAVMPAQVPERSHIIYTQRDIASGCA
jgi:hypothetical protein